MIRFLNCKNKVFIVNDIDICLIKLVMAESFAFKGTLWQRAERQEFRRLRTATKDSVFGICKSLKRLERNFNRLRSAEENGQVIKQFTI